MVIKPMAIMIHIRFPPMNGCMSKATKYRITAMRPTINNKKENAAYNLAQEPRRSSKKE
jgi:hypothetical protein